MKTLDSSSIFTNNYEVMIPYKITSSGEVRINCPFCELHGKTPDTKFHLYISPTLGLYHCFRCGAKGKVENLPEDVKSLITNLPKDVKTPELIEDKNLQLPPGFYEYGQRLSDLMYVENFLAGKLRTLPEIVREELWMYYGVVYNNFDLWVKYKSINMLGETDYYVLRRPYTRNFMNAPSTHKSLFKVGIYKYPSVKKLAIVEGPTDAFSVYLHSKIPAVALLGKYWNGKQLAELKQIADVPGGTVIVALDKDAEEDARKLAKVLKTVLIKAGVSRLEYSNDAPKDPGEIGDIFKSPFVKIVTERGVL